MRQPQSEKRPGVHQFPAKDDDHQRKCKPDRRGGLNPACRIAAFAGACVLGHIGRGAAVFATDREALKQAQSHQQRRRKPTDAGVGRQQTDQESRRPHHHDGDQEGVFTAHQVADATEK